MDLNFFQWFRDSIRRTVLLGVSDAMQDLGTPDDDGSIHPQMAALIGNTEASETAAPKATRSRARGTTGNSRKRLGKSLKELNPESATKKAA